MKTELQNNLSVFIDDIIKYKFDDLKIEYFLEKKKYSYVIELKTGKIVKDTCLNFIINEEEDKIILTVCEDGCITLEKNTLDTFYDIDIDFCSKYFPIIKDAYHRKQKSILSLLLSTSYSDLGILRESNLDKLIDI